MVYMPVHLFDHTSRPNTTLTALVDTGASGNALDDRLAYALKLPIVDFVPASGIDGKKTRPRFLANIHLPQLNQTVFGTFLGVNLIEGVNSNEQVLGPCQILLGREFLRNFSVVYTGQTREVVITPEVVTL